MKKYIIIFAVLSIITPLIIGAGFIAGRPPSGTPPAGPDQYYYGVGSDTYPSNYTMANTELWGDEIAIGQSGLVTSVGFKIQSLSDGNNAKLAIYRSSTLLGCYSVSGFSTGWNDATVSPGLSVSAETLRVEVIMDGFASIYHAGTSGGLYDGGNSYGSACYSTPQCSNEYEYAVRLYVD